MMILPKLSISLVEGNEVAYQLQDHCAEDTSSLFPSGLLELNIKITNIGANDAEILSIRVDYPYNPL